jgi:hypothetical protein
MNAFAEVRRIAFELSNRCVLAEKHLKCPAHLKIHDAVRNLPARAVQGVLEEFRKNVPSFAGFLYFHLYNEPTADPRLMEFVRLASRSLPRALIQITTNGWNYDQTIHDELKAAGVRAVRFSVYSRHDYERLAKISANGVRITFSTTPKDAAKNPEFWKADEDAAWRHVLRSDIPSVYGDAPISPVIGRCLAPYRELCVTSSGDVGLCCMDWKRSVTFGNVLEAGVTISSILHSPPMENAYLNLREGRRIFPVCRRCRHLD